MTEIISDRLQSPTASLLSSAYKGRRHYRLGDRRQERATHLSQTTRKKGIYYHRSVNKLPRNHDLSA